MFCHTEFHRQQQIGSLKGLKRNLTAFQTFSKTAAKEITKTDIISYQPFLIFFIYQQFLIRYYSLIFSLLLLIGHSG